MSIIQSIYLWFSLNIFFRQILHFDPQQRMETEGMPVDVREVDSVSSKISMILFIVFYSFFIYLIYFWIFYSEQNSLQLLEILENFKTLRKMNCFFKKSEVELTLKKQQQFFHYVQIFIFPEKKTIATQNSWIASLTTISQMLILLISCHFKWEF